MMDHLIGTSKVGVFVLKDIEAMRTCCYDLANAVAIHHLNVVHRLHLKEEFISSASCGISIAGFFRSQNCEAYSGCRQDLRESNGDTLVSVVERSGATHPKKYFRCLTFRNELSNGWYCHMLRDQLKRSAGENFHGAKLVSTF